jgi:xylan 1,4-beta-xylosidase
MSLSLRKSHSEALRKSVTDIGFRQIRGHGIFHEDMGILRTSEVNGDQVVRYSFLYLDQVIDSYLEAGVAPLLELGFMPKALASGDQTVFWWGGNVTPPKDYRQWCDLVQATLRHLIDRYGEEAVRWPIEVWNEPNLSHFWKDADQDEYFRLYEYTARAIKGVDERFLVGGPVLSPGSDDWWAPFSAFIERTGAPIDFVSRHAYTSGPAEHVPFGVYQTLTEPQGLIEQFAVPGRELSGTRLAGLPVHISEYNTSYRPDSPVHDTAYNAVYLAPVLARGGMTGVSSFSYWTVSDVFEEEGVPRSLFHGGFGLIAHENIPKPTYHLFTFMAAMGRDILASGDDHLVTRHADGRVAVLAWQPVTGAPVTPAKSHRVSLSIPLEHPVHAATPTSAYASRQRVNETMGNAWTAWQAMGRPPAPNKEQLRHLHLAATPAHSVVVHPINAGRVELDLELDLHEITLVELTAVRDATEPWHDDTRIPGYAHQTA